MSFARVTLIVVALLIVVAAWQHVGRGSAPVTGTAEIGGSRFRYRLERTHSGRGDQRVVIPIHHTEIQGAIEWMPRENGSWTTTPMAQEGASLVGSIPRPPSGQVLLYRVRLTHVGSEVVIPEGDPVELRFR